MPKKPPVKVNGKTQIDQDNSDVPRDGHKTAESPQMGYKVALAIITILAFATRFYGLGHPDQVVFDEVHFGKVRSIVLL